MNEADAQVVVQDAGINWAETGKSLWYEWQVLKKSNGEKVLSSAEFSRFVYDCLNDEGDEDSLFDEEDYETEPHDFAQDASGDLSLEEEIELAKKRVRDTDEGSEDSLLHVVDKLSGASRGSKGRGRGRGRKNARNVEVKERTDLTEIMDESDFVKTATTKGVTTGETTEEELDLDDSLVDATGSMDIDVEEAGDDMMLRGWGDQSTQTLYYDSDDDQDIIVDESSMDPTDTMTNDTLRVIHSSAKNPAKQLHSLITVKGQAESFNVMKDCCVKMAMKCTANASKSSGSSKKMSSSCGKFSCPHFGSSISADVSERTTIDDISYNVRKAKQVSQMYNLLNMAQTDDTISSRISDRAEDALGNMVSLSDNLYSEFSLANVSSSLVFSEYNGIDLRKLKNTELDDISNNVGLIRESAFASMAAKSLNRDGDEIGESVKAISKKFIKYLQSFRREDEVYVAYQCVVAYVLGLAAQMHETYNRKKKPAQRRQIGAKEVDILKMVENAMFNNNPDWLTTLEKDHVPMRTTRNRSKTLRRLQRFTKKGSRMTGAIFGDNQFQHLRKHASQCLVVFENKYQKVRDVQGRQNKAFLYDLARRTILDYSFKKAKSAAKSIGTAMGAMVGKSKSDGLKAAVRIFSMIGINLLTYTTWDDVSLKDYPAWGSGSVFANLEAYMYQARVLAARGAGIPTPPKPASITVDDSTDGIPGEHDFGEDAPPIPSRGRRIELSNHRNDPNADSVARVSQEEKSFVYNVVQFMIDEDMLHDRRGGTKHVTILVPEKRKLTHPTQSKFINGSLHSFVLNQSPYVNKGDRSFAVDRDGRATKEHWSGCTTISGKRGLDYLFDKEEGKIYPMDTERTRAVKNQVGTTIQHPSGQVFAPQTTIKRFRSEIPVSPAFSVTRAGISKDFFPNHRMMVSLRRIHRDH